MILCALSVPVASATTVRFDTNVGTFDMELNPTGNPNLDGHVSNMLRYVRNGQYDLTVINRAAEGFVLQMGGFRAPFLSMPESFNAFPSVADFGPVVVDENGDNQIDFSTGSLSNTRGTVSLALSNTTVGQDSVPDVNSGSNSFFINLGDNSSQLDPGATRTVPTPDGGVRQVPAGGFIPFAEISNMATIDLIMSLPQTNLGNNAAASDIPTLEEDMLVIIEQAFIVNETQQTGEMPGVPGGDNAGIGSPPPPQDVVGVPEPGSLALAATALLLTASRRRRRR